MTRSIKTDHNLYKPFFNSKKSSKVKIMKIKYPKNPYSIGYSLEAIGLECNLDFGVTLIERAFRGCLINHNSRRRK